MGLEIIYLNLEEILEGSKISLSKTNESWGTGGSGEVPDSVSQIPVGESARKLKFNTFPR